MNGKPVSHAQARNRSPTDEPYRVAVVGWQPFSTRCVNLLRGRGIDAFFVPSPPRLRLGQHIANLRSLLKANVILSMGGRSRLSKVQWILSRLGIPVVVAWLGSDVTLFASRANEDIRELAWNWAQSSWLREELMATGFPEVEVAPLVFVSIPDKAPPLPEQFRVLAYAPDGRNALYRFDLILELATQLPEVEFRVTSTTTTSEEPANVRCLGHVPDMAPFFREAAVVVRPTTHDGMAHMVVEMLAHGRYALWTHDLPGVISFENVEVAGAHLRRLLLAHQRKELLLNTFGREEVLRRYHPDAVGAWLASHLSTVVDIGWRRSPGRLGRTLRRTLRQALQALLWTRNRVVSSG